MPIFRRAVLVLALSWMSPVAAFDPNGDTTRVGPPPSGAGFTRPVQEWFSDRANVLAFPGPDLSAKFKAACASLPATGGSIYIPKGVHSSTGALRCDGRNIDVGGDGPGVTTIAFTSAAAGQAGMTLSPGNVTTRATVHDLTLITTVDQVAGNAALSIVYPGGGGTIFKGPRVSNVDISGSGNNEQYWATGLLAQNASIFQFEDLSIRGKNIGSAAIFPSANMGAAIDIVGTPGQQCSDGRIVNVSVAFAAYVGRARGDCEGLHWNNVTGIATDNGIAYPDSKGTPSVYVADSHFNTFTSGVVLAGLVQGTIHDTLFYKWTGSSRNWVGISLETHDEGGRSFASNGNLIHHNTFIGFASGGTPGGDAVAMAAPGSDGNTFSFNSATLVDWVFDFGDVGSTNVAADNTAYAVTRGWQKRVGFNTISRNNTPVQVGTDPAVVPIAPGARTANIGAWFQRVFRTNNAAAGVTMTDFTNAETGRQVTIIAGDANTTIANGARIHLKDGADMRMRSGASLTLLNVGGFWQEVGRSQ